MSKLPRTIATFLLGILSLTIMQAQQSITLGGISVELGMKREEALAPFRNSRFEIIDLKNDAWLITEPRDGQAVANSIGNLQFSGGRLFSAQRTWARSDNPDAIKIIDLLFTALQTQVGKEPRFAQIYTQQMAIPALVERSIDIVIGQTRFRISSITGDNVAPSVDITEEIRRQPKK